jgi:hypothetical protein
MPACRQYRRDSSNSGRSRPKRGQARVQIARSNLTARGRPFDWRAVVDETRSEPSPASEKYRATSRRQIPQQIKFLRSNSHSGKFSTSCCHCISQPHGSDHSEAATLAEMPLARIPSLGYQDFSLGQLSLINFGCTWHPGGPSATGGAPANVRPETPAQSKIAVYITPHLPGDTSSRTL